MSSDKPRGSVVIPAHNEGEVILRCLNALFTGIEPDDLDVIVVCNGCHDDTAALARSSSQRVRVLELAEASKAAALRAGDSAVVAFPRLYIDADVVLAGPSALSVIERLNAGAVAARPPLVYDSSRSVALVRGYYRARARLPAVMRSLWGAGVYGLSAAGRARFDEFPYVTADDLWLDRQFAPDEVEIVDCTPVVVAVPRRSRDLVHTLRRTYRGKAENRPGARNDERARATTAGVVRDLRRLASSGPGAAVDALIYASFAAGGRMRLALGSGGGVSGGGGWERDSSSRAQASEVDRAGGRS